MIIMTVDLRVPVADIARLRPHMDEVIAASRAEPGCLAYTYAADLHTPGLFRVFEIYKDQAALDAHWASPHFLKWKDVSAHCPREARTLYDATKRP